MNFRLNSETKISIIIPCYNSVSTIEDTLSSIKNQSYSNWEAIIIDDGSEDNLELVIQKYLKMDSRFKFFTKINEGLAKARNTAIKLSTGEYILPLDSDNKIGPDFLKKAAPIMDSQSKIGVIYGDAVYFGEKKGLWKIGSFDKYKMLNHNYIDACAVIRKSLFDTLGYYDENLPYQGHEDWEFWLRVITSPYSFYYLPEVTFYYRVSSLSMINSFSADMFKENIVYIKEKHYQQYIESFSELYNKYKILEKNPLVKLSNKLMKML